ncbi:hypothetical protein EOD41_04445 [Mucilaginibacter limnophilus]|uniref:SMP-30/Gluconolactonase/LRE-like region domain-containing protein n=1 Tax=Mucilaginibacter limnophilus TaxID=1932778 RepID=A0A437MU79_9SPHI|nr:hypothetical protein [Mucilaginibacter limnophilus]RVU01221.1 hypothetical protein EOD41_04445 [Mucilaginibacter limnophilus]
MEKHFKLFATTVFILCVCLASCKKSNQVEDGDTRSGLAATASATLNAVTTIAGSAYTSGPTLADGTGAEARFNIPNGIQLADDGNMYIADSNPGVIRKLSPQGVVSTITLSNAASGEQMLGSKYVGVAKDGTINVITGSNLNSDFPEAWIFRPDKTVFVFSGYYAAYCNLAKDPYQDIFWFTNGFGMAKYKVSADGYVIGTDREVFDADSIFSQYNPHSSFSALYIGYNKVKYTSEGYYIYKYTPGGILQRIFKELGVEGFTNITSLVANKDGRTIYIADAGFIRRIDNGRLTTIAGPNPSGDNRDGIGKNADVHASCLALSKDEGTLYFSDSKAKAIRKITLR